MQTKAITPSNTILKVYSEASSINVIPLEIAPGPHNIGMARGVMVISFGIFFSFSFIQFHMGKMCLQHIISDFKDDDTSHNPESVC